MLNPAMDDLLEKISHYGYPGLFLALVLGIVGLPVPDETLLVFCGYLSSRGTMHVVITWITAVLGSTGGISLSYWIGRSAGHSFILRYGRYIHFTEERLLKVQHWFDRIGHWLLTFGYYIPGVRHFTALVAGMSGVSYKSFAMFAYPGALLWVSTFVGLGYVLGERWRQMFEIIHRETLLVGMGLLVVGWIVWTIKRRWY